MNYSQLIMDTEGINNTVAEYAGEIIYETNRVAEIVRNLLKFARQRPRNKVIPMRKSMILSVRHYR